MEDVDLVMQKEVKVSLLGMKNDETKQLAKKNNIKPTASAGDGS